jgi:hypothetical protein
MKVIKTPFEGGWHILIVDNDVSLFPNFYGVVIPTSSILQIEALLLASKNLPSNGFLLPIQEVADDAGANLADHVTTYDNVLAGRDDGEYVDFAVRDEDGAHIYFELENIPLNLFGDVEILISQVFNLH